MRRTFTCLLCDRIVSHEEGLREEGRCEEPSEDHVLITPPQPPQIFIMASRQASLSAFTFHLWYFYFLQYLLSSGIVI